MRAFPPHSVASREAERAASPIPVGLLGSGVLLFATVVALAVVLLQAN